MMFVQHFSSKCTANNTVYYATTIRKPINLLKGIEAQNIIHSKVMLHYFLPGTLQMRKMK